MLSKISFLLFALILSNALHARTLTDSTWKNLIVAGKSNFQVIGDESKTLTNSLFSEFPKTRKRGYIWKFKKLKIEGLNKPVNITIHQGIYGRLTDTSNTETCKNSFYFTTFTSYKNKQQKLNNIKNTEQEAIIIYINTRNPNRISCEDAKIIKTYLISLYRTI